MQNQKTGELSQLLKAIDDVSPLITEKIITLSETGFSPRIYSYWREKGIVGEKAEEGEIHKWVKLNLFDFVWLEIVKSLREFGFSVQDIKLLRADLFKNFLDEIKMSGKEINSLIKEYSSDTFNDSELEKINEAFQQPNPDFETHKLLFSSFALVIIRILTHNETIALTIQKTGKEVYSLFLNEKVLQNQKNDLNEWLNEPHIAIPINPIVQKFIENPKYEANLLYWGVLNEDEQKVLDAIRKKEFKEITIRFNGKDKKGMTLEGTIEGDILNEKALEAKKIFGLNQYSEVSIKYRSDKHLYFKCKVKL